MPGKKRKVKKRTGQPGLLKKTAKRKRAKPSVLSFIGKGITVWHALKDRRWPGIICVVLIVLVGLLAYSNSFRGAFVFDDTTNISENSDIQSLGSAITDTLHSRVIGYFTFALNYKIHGLEVAGYHAVNLAIHLSCALLVFWLVLLTLRTPFFEGSELARSRYIPLLIALFAGVVFVSHPVQTQAVTYLVQRFTSLATLFYLLSLTLYAKWRLSGDDAGKLGILGYKVTLIPGIKKVFFYACSLAAALLAMLTKEIAFTLPAVVALWEFSFFEGGIKRRIKNLLPFFLTLPVVPLTILSSDAPLLSAVGDAEPPPATDYLLTQFRVIVTYLRLFFLPAEQNLDYDYPVYSSFLDPNVLFSFILLLAIAGLGVFLWRHSNKKSDYSLLRLASFGIFWFFITLSVESSFITITDVIYEHRLYLPSVGIITVVIAGIAAGTMALRNRVQSVGIVVIPVAVLVFVSLAVTAFYRNRVWNDPLSVWEDSARKSPWKARPHYNLGYYYQHNTQTDKAEAEFKRALELNPDLARAHFNLGIIYRDKGQLELAEAEYLRAMELMPEHAEAHINLGILYADSGRPEKAEVEFLRAIELKPDFSDAYYNLGMNYIYANRQEDAIEPFKKAIELNPENYIAHNNLGRIYAMQKQYDKALAEFQTALRINPEYQMARDNIRILQGIMGS